ncbi:zinc-binding alcohol dehydrogenase family protein [Oerskovia sp. Sa1BUA8]|uniref:Zinc-binding alcohol dehydrogenase family protein n=1 Tax=Oerskovia douganii TaxID=2762210 RepID=A0A9D5YYG2_9CELL|nr:zinc-binding alcohol dehydrogenase family protein [Oerskovia douganii]MBE7700135.1 zinc-binding alcohol dehydrogenase family protein [Oerskovia douganii]
MHAALVTSFDRPPRWTEVPDPEPGPGEVLVHVLAAGLHPRVRSGAAGTHYTSDGVLPLVPGFDGVGRTEDGRRVFFAGLEAPRGSMADLVAVPADDLVDLPEGLDDVTVAAVMNPAMSAWLALRHRAGLRPGEAVLVLGATGNAGRLAVQLARHLGAGRVVGAGRDPASLAVVRRLGADAVVPLTADDAAERLAREAADVDVVVDYVWGAPTEGALAAVTGARSDPAHLLRWVHVGATAGPTITLPAATLRKTNVQVSGSGQGSVSPVAMVSALRELAAALPQVRPQVDVVTTPLREVEAAWGATTASGTRIVLVP